MNEPLNMVNMSKTLFYKRSNNYCGICGLFLFTKYINVCHALVTQKEIKAGNAIFTTIQVL